MFFALMGTMIIGGLWHGASWNFVLWGFVHGLLLILHRALKNTKPIIYIYSKVPRISMLVAWIITQYLIFMTWLIFRLENTSTLIVSLKTYVGINSYWDMQEMIDQLPTIKYLTFALAGFFILGHILSWKVGGLKIWISKQNPLIWGFLIGTMLTLALFLRPVETVDFIYFRF